MSETQVQGPLDKARGIARQIEEIDGFTTELLLECPEAAEDVEQTLTGLNAAHPLLGQEVIIYGTSLTISMEGLDGYPFALPNERAGELTKQHGTYEGLSVHYVFDGNQEAHYPALMHTIYTGSSQRVLDDCGDRQQMHYYDYVLVRGSEVVSALPLSAHSFRDLASDRVIGEIDRIAIDEHRSAAEKVSNLRFMNQVLANLEAEDELNHQRVSYINSLGLLDGVSMLINDMIITDQHDPGTVLYMSQPSEPPVLLRPNMFTLAPGYDRLADGQPPLMGGPPELHARITLADNQAMLAPLKNVVEVRPVEGYSVD